MATISTSQTFDSAARDGKIAAGRIMTWLVGIVAAAAATLAAATLTPIYANVQQMNDANVIGNGTAGNKWRGA